MKKRILAFILCAIMCLSCASFIACDKERPIEEKPFYDYVEALDEKDEAFKLQQTFVISDKEIPGNDGGYFFTTYQRVLDENSGDLLKTVYRLYSYKAGKVGEEIVKPYDENVDGEQVYGINVYYADGYAFVAKVYGEYDEYYDEIYQYNEETDQYEWVWVGKFVEDPYNCEVTVYDEYGNKVMDFEPSFAVSSSSSYNYNFDSVFSFYTVGGKRCAYYDNKLFEITEKGETKLLKNFEGTSIDFNNLIVNGSFIDADSFYVYRSNSLSSNVYTYFDKEFNYLKTFTYFNTDNVQSIDNIILPNGNIFFMKSEFLGNNDKDYDIKTVHPYTGELVYTRCIYELYNASTGELNEIEIPEGIIINDVTLAENAGFDANKAVAFVEANKIIDGNVYNEPLYFFMDNNASFIAEIKIPHDAIDYYRVFDNAVIVELPFVSFLYKNDGTKIGAIDTSYLYTTASYFVYEDKIVNMNLETVFEIPEDYDMVKIYKDFDTIFFSTESEDEEGNEIEVYYKWNGTATKLDCDDFDYESEIYILEFEETIEDENGERVKYTSKVYAPNGAELFTITSEDEADYDYEVLADAFVLTVQTEDEEGKITTTYKVYFAD
jgi:hypothetical protein